MQTEVEKEAIRIPEPPENLRGRMSLGTALAFFGPGAIIASLTIGSGETVFATRVGAVFGYAVLWTAFITLIAKGAMVYASNHYITVTGEHPMSRFARIFPGPRGWFPILIGVLAIASFPSFASGLSVGLGTYFQDLGWGNAQVWAIGLILVAGLVRDRCGRVDNHRRHDPTDPAPRPGGRGAIAVLHIQVSPLSPLGEDLAPRAGRGPRRSDEEHR